VTKLDKAGLTIHISGVGRRDALRRATRLGWSPADVFDASNTTAAIRYDLTGLALLIDGGEVVAIDNASATIRTPGGNHLRRFRHTRPSALPLWIIR
jgi:hypothetical protein